MAARKKNFHTEEVRRKIQASQLVNRLTDHVLGKVEMSRTQVTAALGLLKKVLPDLVAAEINSEVTHRYVISAPQPVDTVSEWEQQHRLQ